MKVTAPTASPIAPPKKRIAMIVQYFGKNFCGWQRQQGQVSVQQAIEEALASVCGQRIVVSGAGRTDAGVHASGQVAHFETVSPIPGGRWANVLNARLPADIVVCESVEVPPDWHAQFSATWRRYRYTVFTSPIPNVFYRDLSWHYYFPMDATLIQAALGQMLGEQDLEALRRAGSARKHSRLTVQEALCWRDRDFVYVEMQASGFLYGMMRLLVGLLVEVGRANMSVETFTNIWQQKRRDAVKYAAPPQGLCLIGVGYDRNPFRLQCSAPEWGSLPA